MISVIFLIIGVLLFISPEVLPLKSKNRDVIASLVEGVGLAFVVSAVFIFFYWGR